MHRFSLHLQQAAAWDPKVKDLTANGLEDIFKISEMCRHPSGFKN